MIQGEFTRHGRIEHHFGALDSISIVFVEVKRELATGKAKLDAKAQVLAEAAGELQVSSIFKDSQCTKFYSLRSIQQTARAMGSDIGNFL